MAGSSSATRFSTMARTFSPRWSPASDPAAAARTVRAKNVPNIRRTCPRPRPEFGPAGTTSGNPPAPSERRDMVIKLLAPGRLLNFAQPPATAIDKARLGNLLIGHPVIARDVEGPDDPRNADDPQLVIHEDLLRAAEKQVPIRQNRC